MDEIRAALTAVLGAVERGSDLVFDHDYHWASSVEASFDMNQPAPALTAGQISDDVASVRELLHSRQVVAPWHELGHLVGVLRAVEALDRPRTARATRGPKSEMCSRRDRVGHLLEVGTLSLFGDAVRAQTHVFRSTTTKAARATRTVPITERVRNHAAAEM
ncbi:MAG: hypothetical protein QOH29_2765 [Actinomycetota bacterium]|jgi:hypothetical protein|nr:hypothetical protein [Actinomycetota bacterium]